MPTGRGRGRVCTVCEKRKPLDRFKSARGRICVDCQTSGRAAYAKGVRLFERYGITLEEYDALVEAQGGLCAICGRKPRYALHVDHDHALERAGIVGRRNVRGLLCKLCNGRLLPSVRDDVETLNRAIAYLQDPPAQRLLGQSGVDLG